MSTVDPTWPLQMCSPLGSPPFPARQNPELYEQMAPETPLSIKGSKVEWHYPSAQTGPSFHSGLGSAQAPVHLFHLVPEVLCRLCTFSATSGTSKCPKREGMYHSL
jgi:hypothetical protein